MKDVETANTIVRETMEDRHRTSASNKDGAEDSSDTIAASSPIISNKTLWAVAMANANKMNFDAAYEIATMADKYNHDPLPKLLERIDALKRSHEATIPSVYDDDREVARLGYRVRRHNPKGKDP